MQTNPESAAVEAVAWECRTQYSVWDDCTKEKYDHIIATGHYGGPASVKAEARALYPQSALDALRGEVERLNALIAGGCRRLIEENTRANAAERRVAELERVCKPIIEKSIAISKTTSSVFTSDLRRLLAALTKESP